MRRPASRALLVTALAAPALCAPASADVFGPISLLSSGPLQQFEYAHDTAISGDGRYVVFDGSVGGVTGVWRRENRSGGALVQVAGGDAELPSISQDGRHISFTTNEGARLAEITNGLPDPEHETGESPNVYVRDMGEPGHPKEPAEAGAFTLASALSYEYSSGSSREFEVEHFGAEAAGRTAISADGKKVVFVTTAASNLDGPATPPLQVAVHDLETNTTQIVSVEDDPATGRPVLEEGRPRPVAIHREGSSIRGAVYTEGGPRIFEAPAPYSLPRGVGASISADGSTVAWMAQNLGEQTRLLSAETLLAKDSEPLWRRIAEGEQAPIRRVTGGSDPRNPACAAHPESVLPVSPSLSDPCQGPFASEGAIGLWNGGEGDVVPQLSADGYEVAFLATARPVALGYDFGSGGLERSSDLFIADMHEGVSRTQALQPLTALASGDEARVSTNSRILDLAISADGEQVAFTTRRTVFPLGVPAYVSVPASVPGLGELYEIDLENNTLTRVTHGYSGGAAEHPHAELGLEDPYAEGDGTLSPSFSGEGEELAFSSTASNLVYGDGNTPPLKGVLDGSDAFTVGRVLFDSIPGLQSISPEPPGPTPVHPWSLSVRPLALADGSVMLYAEVPGAGTLTATASISVLAQTRRSARGVRVRRSRAGAGAGARSLVTRTAASATRGVAEGGGGLITLPLALGRGYAALAARPGGLPSRVTVTFGAPGQRTLTQTVPLTFLRTLPRRAARSRVATRRHRPVRARRMG